MTKINIIKLNTNLRKCQEYENGKLLLMKDICHLCPLKENCDRWTKND